jgi:hypothetical protein
MTGTATAIQGDDDPWKDFWVVVYLIMAVSALPLFGLRSSGGPRHASASRLRERSRCTASWAGDAWIRPD